MWVANKLWLGFSSGFVQEAPGRSYFMMSRAFVLSKPGSVLLGPGCMWAISGSLEHLFMELGNWGLGSRAAQGWEGEFRGVM